MYRKPLSCVLIAFFYYSWQSAVSLKKYMKLKLAATWANVVVTGLQASLMSPSSIMSDATIIVPSQSLQSTGQH